MAAIVAAARQIPADPRGEGDARGGRRRDRWWARRPPALAFAPHRRRRSLVPASTALTAGLTLAVAALFGLATLGALPEPVQARLADAAEAVGISVPDPEDEGRPGRRPPRPRATGVSAPAVASIRPRLQVLEQDSGPPIEHAVSPAPRAGCDGHAGAGRAPELSGSAPPDDVSAEPPAPDCAEISPEAPAEPPPLAGDPTVSDDEAGAVDPAGAGGEDPSALPVTGGPHDTWIPYGEQPEAEGQVTRTSR